MSTRLFYPEKIGFWVLGLVLYPKPKNCYTQTQTQKLLGHKRLMSTILIFMLLSFFFHQLSLTILAWLKLFLVVEYTYLAVVQRQRHDQASASWRECRDWSPWRERCGRRDATASCGASSLAGRATAAPGAHSWGGPNDLVWTRHWWHSRPVRSLKCTGIILMWIREVVSSTQIKWILTQKKMS